MQSGREQHRFGWARQNRTLLATPTLCFEQHRGFVPRVFALLISPQPPASGASSASRRVAPSPLPTISLCFQQHSGFVPRVFSLLRHLPGPQLGPGSRACHAEAQSTPSNRAPFAPWRRLHLFNGRTIPPGSNSPIPVRHLSFVFNNILASFLEFLYWRASQIAPAQAGRGPLRAEPRLV